MNGWLCLSLTQFHNSYIIVFYEQGVFQYTLETVVGFLVPYVIIVSSYVCILRRLRQTMFKRRIRSENLIQAIIVTFCLFWLPYHCINIVQVSRFYFSLSFGNLFQNLPKQNVWIIICLLIRWQQLLHQMDYSKRSELNIWKYGPQIFHQMSTEP